MRFEVITFKWPIGNNVKRQKWKWCNSGAIDNIKQLTLSVTRGAYTLNESNETNNLEVAAETVEFVDEEVDVDLADGLVGYDAAEEVGQLTLWLVTHHQRTRRHHATFQDRRDLQHQKNINNQIHRLINQTIVRTTVGYGRLTVELQ